MQIPPADWKPRHDMHAAFSNAEKTPSFEKTAKKRPTCSMSSHWLLSCTATYIPFFRKMLVFVWRSALSTSTWAVSVPSSVYDPLNLAKC